MRKIRIVTLIIMMAIPLLIGGLSAALSANGMMAYGSMNKPPLSPPPWAFSVAWTVLYLMMGLASYFIVVSEAGFRNKSMVLIIYGTQLLMNFMWSIVFFNWEMYLAAFVWLVLLLGIVILCTLMFFNISKTASVLMIPYILWLTFAAYLNLGAYVLRQ